MKKDCMLPELIEASNRPQKCRKVSILSRLKAKADFGWRFFVRMSSLRRKEMILSGLLIPDMCSKFWITERSKAFLVISHSLFIYFSSMVIKGSSFESLNCNVFWLDVELFTQRFLAWRRLLRSQRCCLIKKKRRRKKSKRLKVLNATGAIKPDKSPVNWNIGKKTNLNSRLLTTIN